jgi:hypothetical protein
MPANAISSSATRRSKRIERRCIAPVVEALHAGRISPRSADVFLQLTPRKQAAELERRLSEARRREERHQVVALTIKRYLDGLGDQKVDLAQLSKTIKEAVAS